MRQRILWIDSLAALLTGVLLLTGAPWLAPWYGVPVSWVAAHAGVHLAYGTYSGSLAVRRRRPLPLLYLLIFANAAWTIVCWTLAATGVLEPLLLRANLAAEGTFVGALSAVEWIDRHRLAHPVSIDSN